MGAIESQPQHHSDPGAILDLPLTSYQPGANPSAFQTPLSLSREWYSRVECPVRFRCYITTMVLKV